jgi:hypothetical protein
MIGMVVLGYDTLVLIEAVKTGLFAVCILVKLKNCIVVGVCDAEEDSVGEDGVGVGCGEGSSLKVKNAIDVIDDAVDVNEAETDVVVFSTKIPPNDVLVDASAEAMRGAGVTTAVVLAIIVGIAVDAGPKLVMQRLGSGTVSRVVTKGGLAPSVKKLILITF